MSEPLAVLKKNTLEKRLVELHEEYRAANTQLSSTLSEVDRLRLQRRVEALEEEIQQVETQLAQTGNQSGQDNVSPLAGHDKFTLSFKWVGLSLLGVVGVLGLIYVLLNSRPSINITGDVGQVITDSTIEQLVIQEGDSPEVRQQKAARAKKIIANEILTNLADVDAWLNFVSAALSNRGNETDQQIAELRSTVMPTLAADVASGYERLMAQQAVASLRQAFNSRPLNLEFSEPLIQVLLDSGADPSRIRFFYDQLRQVQDGAESLLIVLEKFAQKKSPDNQAVEYYNKYIDLQIAVLRNQAAIAYLAGLSGLNSLDEARPADAAAQLSLFTQLKPNQLIEDKEVDALLTQQLKEAERLATERAALITQSQGLLNESLEEYQNVNEELPIQPADTWDVVVDKAIKLRQLGQISEAVASFSRYADMFAATDPTAKQYSRTAQQFTLQLEKLGVTGGVYIFEVNPGSSAAQANLSVGDIIIEFDGKTISSMSEMTTALKAVPANTAIPVTILRLEENGNFQRQTITVSAVPLGIGLMPI